MNNMDIKLTFLHCKRCNHKWIPRKAGRRNCPKCNSPHWDKENPIMYIQQPWSEARKQQRSKAFKGHFVSKKTRIKLSQKMKGVPKPPRTHKYKWNEESKHRWSELQKGMKRKKHTLATRQLMSRIARARRPVCCVDESKIARKRFEYKIWRQAVYVRDNYVCLKCKVRGRKLNPHHIMNFAENPEARYDINNGATLCVPCHKAFHKNYGKKKNSRIQFDQFINSKN